MEARKLSHPRASPFQLSLRVRHPSLDPAEISRQLGTKAEYSFRAGDPRPSRSGLAPASVHAESYWLGALNPAEWPADPAVTDDPLLKIARERLPALSRSLGWALSVCALRFFSVHAPLLRRIRAEGGQASVLITMSTTDANSFSLAPEVSRIFSELGIALEFEFGSE
ncbi:MAG TPA: hypothetical protein VEK10_03945 [Steroidobacteraceae bacterium]|nr:hypothetical protein [Steroidobacteraceae bacterium]